MKKLLYIVILLPFITNAQTVNGIIKSHAANLPIEDANVYALLTQIGTLTNEKGEFSLNNKIKPNDTLQISHIGYITSKMAIADLKKSNYIISLEEDIESLKNVTIANNRWSKLKSKLDFTKLAPLEYGIYSFGSLVADGKIYVVGGDNSEQWNALTNIKSKDIGGGDPTRFNDPVFVNKYLQEIGGDQSKVFYKGDLFIYDPKTDVWEKSKQKLKKRAYHSINFYNNTLYVLGGKRGPLGNKKHEFLDNEIEVFDLNTNQIAIDKTNPHKAVNFASFTYKDNIIVMGGSIKSTVRGAKTFTDKVHLYNLTSGLWYELTKMPVAQEVSGVLIEDKIFTIGNSDNRSFSEIQSFDLTTESWKKEATLLCRLENPAVTNHDDTIYIFEDGKLLVYNTKSKLIKEYSIKLELKSAAMHFINDKLYIIGGYNFTNYYTSPSSKTYSISLDEFETTRPDRIRVLSQNNLASGK
ncbi:carboxypeptidase-like regulatory domain-containing protein [Flavobacterium sp. GN10]|uniref:Carboxypeptidase-like regulatory domain-containing protein n=1 Tax=Flavobacterium tagetis TaxID=2801336 RepID=A0ABS1K814_9FLAO|nr:carboxypeptidase-like regulatory domain-containing protein [Flavobacterium tagetis]